MKLYKNNNHIKNISISSILIATSLIMGCSGFFSFFGMKIYFSSVPLFLSPLFLSWKYGLLSTAISVLIIDLITGFIIFVWISLIAYLGAIIILYISNFKLKNKWIYPFSSFIASIWIIIIYFILFYIMFDKAYAIKELIIDLIQMSIVFLFSNIIHKIFKKRLKNYGLPIK